MRQTERRRRVLLFSVMAPEVGGFREHSFVLGKALAATCDITIVSDRIYRLSPVEKAYALEAGITFADLNDRLVQQPDPSIVRIYQLANNPPHGFILLEFMRCTGVVILHDINLYWLLSATDFVNVDFLGSELGCIGGDLTLKALNRRNNPVGAGLTVHATYFNRLVCERAVAVITHSLAMKHVLERSHPDLPIHHLRLICNSIRPIRFLSPADVASARSKFGVPLEANVFGIFGYMTEHKRVRSALSALARLGSDPNRPVNFHVLSVGVWDPLIYELARADLHALREQGRLTLIDRRLERSDMFDLMQTSDVVLNLRYPTAGESSGVAAECNALGVPVLFNRYAGFVDLDDGHNIGLPVTFTQSELIETVREVCGRPMRTYASARQPVLRDKHDASVKGYADRVGAIVGEAEQSYAQRFSRLQFLRYLESVRRPDYPFKTVWHVHAPKAYQLFMFGREQCHVIEQHVGVEPPHLVNMALSPAMSLEAALESVADRGVLTDAVVADSSVAGQRLLGLLVTLVKRLPIGGTIIVPKARTSTLVALLRDPFDGDYLGYATVLQTALRGRNTADLLVMALGLSVHEPNSADRDAAAYQPLSIYRKETSVINYEFLSYPGESMDFETHRELRQ